MEDTVKDTIDLGVWIGRGQAFGVIANGCTAAQAECLRQIRDSDAYKQTGLNWEDFCQEYVGLSRPRVDALIGNLEEFGRTYFDLSNIVRISPEAYRRVASTIKGQSIQIGTELVPIIPENAPRIRRVIQQARSEASKARHRAHAMNADANLLMMEFENHFNRAEQLARDYHLTKGEYESLQMIHEYVSGRVSRLEEALERSPRATVDEE
jgi:hypothetical protein